MVKGNIKILGYEEKKKAPSFAKPVHTEASGKTPYLIKTSAVATITISQNLKVAIESIIKELDSLLDHNDFKVVDKATNLVYQNMKSAKKHLKHGIGYI